MEKKYFLAMLLIVPLLFIISAVSVKAAPPTPDGWWGWRCGYLGCVSNICGVWPTTSPTATAYGVTDFTTGSGASNFYEVCQVLDTYSINDAAKSGALSCSIDNDCLNPTTDSVYNYTDVCTPDRCPTAADCSASPVPGACSEGATCQVQEFNDPFVIPGPHSTCTGNWDPDEGACVKCDFGTHTELNYYGISTTTSDDSCCFKGTCTTAGYGKCEQACGADPQCDEASYGMGVAVSGGVCNNCVFGPSPCGNGHLDSGEDCDIGPDKIPGTADDIDDNCRGQCQADCKCPAAGACKTGPSYYTCQKAGIKCLTCSEELQGGLVPCGRNCDDPCTAECECAPCTLCHLFVLFKRIIDFLAKDVLFPLAVLMIVIGGVMFLTAAGDPGRIGTAKKILTSVVIGLVIIFLAWLIVDTIIMFITNSGSPFRNWKDINCPLPEEAAGSCTSDTDCSSPTPFAEMENVQ